jgi:hypothetical protein
MPPDAPGTLSENDAIDIVAYVLKTNGLPAGGAEIERANQFNAQKMTRPK